MSSNRVPWYRRRLVGFDTETTGTDVETAQIVTASVVHYGGGQPTTVRSWVSDLDGAEIPPDATAIHGWTTEAARAQGRPAAEVVEEITTTLAEAADADRPVVVMNAPFDLTVLDRESRRHGVRPLINRAVPRVVDPRVLDKKVDPYRRGGRTLTDLCRHYVVGLENAHTADADAVAACAIVWKLAIRHPWLGRLDLGVLHEDQARWAHRQAVSLRAHFERTEGKEHLAGTVRTDWPLIPAPRTGTPW
ncbi:exonuclease domain-containing protein [Streptomyces sp. DH12]|uniref:exonuclease domain-containing protein n=1 Tax=Streptomyces sp. DH12 TaxID=2857010 RepID=UPI001E29A6E3|nr:exonuclease domain-containing protein [Streptomyces sp. DH12]